MALYNNYIPNNDSIDDIESLIGSLLSLNGEGFGNLNGVIATLAAGYHLGNVSDWIGQQKADLLEALGYSDTPIISYLIALNALVTGTEDITFHDEATVAADGLIYTVGRYKTITLEIYGTSTSRTVAFYGRGASGTDIPLLGTNFTTATMATSTTGTGELWQFEVGGLTSFYADLQAVSGGNVSIKGKALA